MSEIEEVQEQMKADMEAMKDQMAAMLSMKKIMESNAAAVATTSAPIEEDPTHPSGLNKVNPPVSDMVGQGREALGSTGGPHVVQSKNSFPPYGLPPNYTPPNVAHAPDENVNNSTPILIESRQPQFDHAHVSQPMGRHMRHPNLVNFEPHLRYAFEGQAFYGIPLPNTLGGPQYHPQPQPLHFVVGRVPPAMVEREKFNHIEETLKAIEGGENYAFADMVRPRSLVPDIVIPPKFKVPNYRRIRQRWRDLAAEVAPSMMEKEMITMIVDTLPMFYYEKMLGYTPSSFADLVFAGGERIEVGLKRGKFDHPTLMNKKHGANGENKKEGGTHVVTAIPTWPNFPPAQQCKYSAKNTQ
ncbi:hypothetical protein HKD37_05G012813 [Glycine soja]